MHVAVDLHHTCTWKCYLPALSFRVISKVERARRGERKNVVKYQIQVRKFYGGAFWYDYQLWFKTMVSLFDRRRDRRQDFRTIGLEPNRYSLELVCASQGGSGAFHGSGSKVVSCSGNGCPPHILLQD